MEKKSSSNTVLSRVTFFTDIIVPIKIQPYSMNKNRSREGNAQKELPNPREERTFKHDNMSYLQIFRAGQEKIVVLDCHTTGTEGNAYGWIDR